MASKKPDKPAAKMGRPLLDIDWEVFDDACYIQCTQEEIARLCQCSVDTLDRRCKSDKDMSLAEYYKIKSEPGKKSLRRRLFEIAMSDSNRGSTAAAIWLSKQYLGMRDKQDDDRFKEFEPLVIETSKGETVLKIGKKESK